MDIKDRVQEVADLASKPDKLEEFAKRTLARRFRGLDLDQDAEGEEERIRPRRGRRRPVVRTGDAERIGDRPPWRRRGGRR